VRVAEERAAGAEEKVADADARTDELRVELKERAMATLRRLGEEGRERIAAERTRRREAEARLAHAEEARNRAESAFEQVQQRTQGDRESLARELNAARAESEKATADAVGRAGEEASKLMREKLEGVQREADQRIAAAEQRAAGDNA